jgi:hypothetical protein
MPVNYLLRVALATRLVSEYLFEQTYHPAIHRILKIEKFAFRASISRFTDHSRFEKRQGNAEFDVIFSYWERYRNGRSSLFWGQRLSKGRISRLSRIPLPISFRCWLKLDEGTSSEWYQFLKWANCFDADTRQYVPRSISEYFDCLWRGSRWTIFEYHDRLVSLCIAMRRLSRAILSFDSEIQHFFWLSREICRSRLKHLMGIQSRWISHSKRR